MIHKRKYGLLQRHLNSHLLVLLVFVIVTGSCKKDSATKTPPADQNTIDRLIADNFNLTLFNALIDRGGFRNILQEKKLLTAFAPSDQAFQDASFKGTASIIALSTSQANAMTSYHVLNGNISFANLPLEFNHELKAQNGRSLFVTRWRTNADTVVTINGAKVLFKDIKASNGLVHVIDKVLSPNKYDKISDAVAAEKELTIFYQAIVRSNMLDILNKPDIYTVYAPTNKAMREYGLQSVVDVNQRSAQEMAALVKRHIVSGRKFINDYIILQTKIQQMLDQSATSITLISDPKAPGSFNGIALMGAGNKVPVKLFQRDIVAANGVLHLVDGVILNEP